MAALWAVSAAAAQGPSPAAGPDLAAAEELLAGGDPAAAEEAFGRLLDQSPLLVPAWDGLARALEAQGRGGEAASRLTAVGERLMRGARFEEAGRVAGRAVALAPDSFPATQLLGRALAQAGRYLQAEAPLRGAARLAPGDARTALYLGSTLWENGRLAEAEAELRRASALAGGAAAAEQLGRLLLWQGRFGEATPVLERAVRRRPGAPDLQFALGRSREGNDDPQGAEAAYLAVLELASDHGPAHYRLARLLTLRGETEAAAREMEVYRRLYEASQERTRSEGLGRARVDFGLDLLRQGRARAAVEHLQVLPESADGLAALGLALAAADEHPRAVAAYERALVLAPDRRDLAARLAEARLAAGTKE